MSENSSDDSSSVTISPVKSTSNSPQLSDAERQILLWAGKLETESIDLRENASNLMRGLKRVNQNFIDRTTQIEKTLIKGEQFNGMYCLSFCFYLGLSSFTSN